MHSIDQYGATDLTCETQGYLPGDLYVLGRPVRVSVLLDIRCVRAEYLGINIDDNIVATVCHCSSSVAVLR